MIHTLTTKDRHGVLCEGRIRRLTPRECLRLQGWADDRIDTVLAIQSDLVILIVRKVLFITTAYTMSVSN